MPAACAESSNVNGSSETNFSAVGLQQPHPLSPLRAAAVGWSRGTGLWLTRASVIMWREEDLEGLESVAAACPPMATASTATVVKPSDAR